MRATLEGKVSQSVTKRVVQICGVLIIYPTSVVIKYSSISGIHPDLLCQRFYNRFVHLSLKSGSHKSKCVTQKGGGLYLTSINNILPLSYQVTIIQKHPMYTSMPNIQTDIESRYYSWPYRC